MTASAGGTDGGALDTDRAFSIWRRTALAASRLTSAVELYGADGALNSRFALNIPGRRRHRVRREPARGVNGRSLARAVLFGAEERRMLHAERGLCVAGPDGTHAPAGAVVVHMVQVDYESLPFLSSRSPYVELFAGPDASPVPGAPGHDRRAGRLRLGVAANLRLQPDRVGDRRPRVSADLRAVARALLDPVAKEDSHPLPTSLSPTTGPVSTHSGTPSTPGSTTCCTCRSSPSS